MIRFGMEHGELTIEQIAKPPLVYFDQWVWCDLADDADFRANMSARLHTMRATIVFTVATFAEMSKITISEQQDKILDFVNGHDFAFFDANPIHVIRRERLATSERPTPNPAFDVEFLLAVAAQGQIQPAAPSDVLRDLFAQENLEAAANLVRGFGDSLTHDLERARETPNAIKRAQERQHQRRTTCPLGPPTERLYEATLDFMILNNKMRIDSRDWLDLLHLIVPCAYTDFVFTDKRWAEALRIEVNYAQTAKIVTKRDMVRFLQEPLP